MKRKLDILLKEALRKCFEAGKLKETSLPEYVIEVPNNSSHGHFATNLPLVLATSQRRRPRDLATVIVDNLEDRDRLIEKADIAGPGFINFTITAQHWQKFLADILVLGTDFGRSAMGAGQKVLVEFVSANPTGPLHLGHGRGAALGDTLCRILSFCGFDVSREFYINDAGRQVRLLGESIWSRWKQQSDPGVPFPENGYHGEYIRELAAARGVRVVLILQGRSDHRWFQRVERALYRYFLEHGIPEALAEVNGEKGTVLWNFEDQNYLLFYDNQLPPKDAGFRKINVTWFGIYLNNIIRRPGLKKFRLGNIRLNFIKY